jgi:hypothetical protein
MRFALVCLLPPSADVEPRAPFALLASVAAASEAPDERAAPIAMVGGKRAGVPGSMDGYPRPRPASTLRHMLPAQPQTHHPGFADHDPAQCKRATGSPRRRWQQRFRDGEAEGLSGREIDDQINFAPSGDFLSKRLSLDRFSDR